MSNNFTELDALVLRVTPYSDSSVYLHALSKQQGKVMLRLRGIKRKNSPLLAYGEPLVYARFNVFDYRGRQTVNDAEAHSFFMPLRSDLRKLALAKYIADVAELVADVDVPDNDVLTLTLHALHKLCGDKYAQEHVKAVFEWRMAAIAGYRLEQAEPAVLHCQNAPLDKVFAFAVDDTAWRGAGEAYLQTHLAHRFESLEYYKSMREI